VRVRAVDDHISDRRIERCRRGLHDELGDAPTITDGAFRRQSGDGPCCERLERHGHGTRQVFLAIDPGRKDVDQLRPIGEDRTRQRDVDPCGHAPTLPRIRGDETVYDPPATRVDAAVKRPPSLTPAQ